MRTRRCLIRSQAGFSLIELTMAIGVIAILITAVTLGAGVVTSSRLSTAERDIRTLYSATTAWAAQQATPTFSGATVAAMKTAGVLPSNATGNNPWGNAYTTSGTATSFTVTTDASTAANCGTLSARLAPAATTTSCSTSTLTVTF